MFSPVSSGIVIMLLVMVIGHFLLVAVAVGLVVGLFVIVLCFVGGAVTVVVPFFSQTASLDSSPVRRRTPENTRKLVQLAPSLRLVVSLDRVFHANFSRVMS